MFRFSGGRACAAGCGLLIAAACSSPGSIGNDNENPEPTDDTVSVGGGSSTGAGAADATSSSQASGSASSSSGGNNEPMPCNGGDSTVHNGQATWYELDTPLVNCSYETETLPQYYGAMNTVQYADAAVCGACVRVQGPLGSVDIQIVDQCPFATNPICYEGHIDLSVPAFEQIADKVTGIIPISWQYIPCDAAGGLRYRFKEGSSQFWAAILVRNHRYPIASVEVGSSDGSFQALERQSYNYFVAEQGLGPGPFTIRTTDIYGGSVEEAGIPLQVGSDIQGQAQLPLCD